jgi:hypothetical protein
MGTIDIDAVIASYSGAEDITTWEQFTAALKANTATGQSKAAPDKTQVRWPNSDDIIASKYVWGYISVNAFAASESNSGLNIPVVGLNVAVAVKNTKAAVFKDSAGVLSEKIAAIRNKASGVDLENDGVSVH